MADLSELDSAGANKIVGADPVTGLETFFADVSSEGELKISSFANVDFQDASKTITTTEQIASVGGANLANRKSLVLFNKGAQTVYYGTTGLTSSTGIAVEKDELIELEVGENIDVYILTNAGTATMIIQEFS